MSFLRANSDSPLSRYLAVPFLGVGPLVFSFDKVTDSAPLSVILYITPLPLNFAMLRHLALVLCPEGFTCILLYMVDIFSSLGSVLEILSVGSSGYYLVLARSALLPFAPVVGSSTWQACFGFLSI